MKYSIKVTNIEGRRINLVKVVRTLEPGMPLVEAKNLVWEKEIVDLSKIRRERHPERYAGDFVFSQEEHDFINYELEDLVDFIVEKSESDLSPIEKAFRAGFEAGIASDDEVEEAWEKFTAKCK